MSSFDSLLYDLTAKANADTEALKKAEREREENALRRKEEQRAKEAMIRSELTVHYRFAAKFKDMVRQSQAAVLNNPRLKKIYLGFCDYKLTRENRDTGVYIRYRFNSNMSDPSISRGQYTDLIDTLCSGIYDEFYTDWKSETGREMEKQDMLCILYIVCSDDNNINLFILKDILDKKTDDLTDLFDLPLMKNKNSNDEFLFTSKLIDYFIYAYYYDFCLNELDFNRTKEFDLHNSKIIEEWKEEQRKAYMKANYKHN